MSIALPAPSPLGDLAARLGGVLDEGLAPRVVDRLAAPGLDDEEGALLPVYRARFVAPAQGARGVWLVSPELAARLPVGRRWQHPQAAWVVAALLGGASSPRDERERALIEPGAQVAASACVGAFCVVRAGARVGEGVVLEEHVVIHGGVELRRGVRIGAGSVVGRPGFGWVQGPGGALRVPHQAGVIVDEEAELGARCTVDAGVLAPTRIGRRARLDSQVHVGHGVVIGEDVMVAAQSGFAGSVELGRGVRVGGQAGFADHVRIGAGAQVAAKSGVIGDVPPGVVVAGYPALERTRWLRALAHLFASPRRSGLPSP